MLRASFVLLIATAMFFNVATAQTCPAGQEWTTCGSACPPSCDSAPNKTCTQKCITGCQCRVGLLLNSAGQCVQPNQC